MIRFLAAAALIVSPSLVGAQTQATAAQDGASGDAVPAQADGQPPQRIRNVQLTPGQKCPSSTNDEIVVCSPLVDPYRIPPALRDSGPIAAQNQSWANRAADIDETSRVAGGLPNTCSPVGTGGQTGCSQQALREWYANRRGQADGQLP